MKKTHWRTIVQISLLASLFGAVVQFLAYGWRALWPEINGLALGFFCCAYVADRAVRVLKDWAHESQQIAAQALEREKQNAQAFAVLAKIAESSELEGVTGLRFFLQFAACAHLKKGAQLTVHELELLTAQCVDRMRARQLIADNDPKVAN